MQNIGIRISAQAHRVLKPAKKKLGADSEKQLASDLILEALKVPAIREKLQRKYNTADWDGIIR